MREGAAALEEGHLVDEIVKEKEVVRAEEVLHNAGCGHRRCRLPHRRHVIEAEIVELGDVELVELVRADQRTQLANLYRKLLSLPPLALVGLLDLVLRLYE